MAVTMTINNGISVDLTLVPKKKKTDRTKYNIYLSFGIYQKGIKQFTPHSISTGMTVNVSEWKQGEVAGRNDKAKLLNERLNEYQSKAKDMLNQLALRKVKTCSQVLEEIKANAKTVVTGKAPRGLKNDFISKLKDYTYKNVMERLIKDKGISVGRQRGYQRSYELLNNFFNEDMPTIDQITTEDLERFNKWFKPKSLNTKTDYQCKIAATFKHAIKLKILNTNPLPEKFRGAFVDGNRAVLSEMDCLKIMNIDDSTLSKTEEVAKYCILVQMLTGMGYSDMKAVKHINIIFDQNENQYLIEKERNKTGVRFKVFLTDNAKHMIENLKQLTGNVEKPFNIPTIDYALRIYKVIGKKAGIIVNVTTYTLRHTFAVNFMENDGRIEDLAKILGHTLLKTTQIYGKISNKRLAEKTKQLQSTSKIHQLQQTMMKAV